MMQTLHVIDTTGPGGAETVFIDLIRGLKSKGVAAQAVIRGPGWVQDQLLDIGVDPIVLDCKGSFNTRFLRKLAGVVRTKKVDLIQSHLTGSNLYCSLAGILCAVPVVCTFHGFVDFKRTDRLAQIKSAIINTGASRIVCVSEQLRRYYIKEQGLSETKSVAIYNGVDTSTFRRNKNEALRIELGLRSKEILVGSVGNVRASKGYKDLLKAAKEVMRLKPHFRFVIAGQGGGTLFEELLALRGELGLDEVVHFVGFQADVPRFLNSLDIYLLPSSSEGFSISLIEAMACGVPVVATKSGGPEEIVKHMQTGILVDPGAPSQIAAALFNLEQDPLLQKHIRQAATNDVLARFSLSRTIDAYHREYSYLVARQ